MIGVALETLETLIARFPLVATSLTRVPERFMNPKSKIRTTRSGPPGHGERQAHVCAERRIYWSRLREIVIVDSVLVLVQRMSRRR
jgi:hypothetical protein